MGIFGQLFQCQGFLEMQVDIAADCSTLAVAGSTLGFRLDSQGSVTHKSGDKDLQVCPADILIACIFCFHFLENISQTRGKLHAFKMIQDAKLTVGVCACCQLDSVNAQNDILKRLRI